MRFIITALFFFGAFCLPQKPVPDADLHTHSQATFTLNELLEIVFTGHVNHAHAHNDHDEDASHSHPHEHASLKLVLLFDFLPAAFNFTFDSFKSPWPNELHMNLAKSFQCEILKPPIS